MKNFTLLFFLMVFGCRNENSAKKEFYDDGTVKSEVEMEEGYKNGRAKYFYPNGAVKNLYSYKDDLIEGPFTSYDEHGNVITKGHYFKGVCVGPIYYYHQGKVVLYNERDFEQEIYYVLKFDSLSSNLIKEEGRCLSPNTREWEDSKNSFTFFFAEPDSSYNNINVFVDGIQTSYEVVSPHVAHVKLPTGSMSIKVFSILKSADSTVKCIDSLVRQFK
jgi:hypothetical protein